MKIADAMKIMKENEGKHLYPVTICSSGEEIPFKPMTVGHHKTVAKMAIDDQDNFDKFLCALILDLSDEGVQMTDINEIDKVAILFQVKQHNSTEPLKITLTCPQGECGTKVTVQPRHEDVVKTDKEFEFSKTVERDGTKYELVFGMPSVQDNMAYYDFCDNRSKLLNDEEKSKLGIFIATYEMFLMSVKSIKIDDNVIEDFPECTIEERISFLEELPEGIINIEKISEFMSAKGEEFGYNAKCPKCEHEFHNILSTDSFFFS
jgi:hypothetical protein